MADNPALQQVFYAAFNGCQSQALNTANGGPAQINQSITQTVTIGPPPVLPPVATFNANGVIAAAEAGQRNRQLDALFTSCMGAQGYVLAAHP